MTKEDIIEKTFSEYIKERNIQANKTFLQGLLKLPVHKIVGKEYVLLKDIGKLSDNTFGKIVQKGDDER